MMVFYLWLIAGLALLVTEMITGGWEENGRAVGGPVQLKRLGAGR